MHCCPSIKDRERFKRSIVNIYTGVCSCVLCIHIIVLTPACLVLVLVLQVPSLGPARLREDSHRGQPASLPAAPAGSPLPLPVREMPGMAWWKQTEKREERREEEEGGECVCMSTRSGYVCTRMRVCVCLSSGILYLAVV